MIRPVTCLAFLLACSSGLYLYQVKHRVKVLDDRIAAVAKSTDGLREQTRMLSAEWTLLNDPERLRKLADEFLHLQPVSPEQFTSLADLDSRLPPPMPQGAPPASDMAPPLVADQAPAASGTPATAGSAGMPAAASAVATAAPAAPPKVADAASPKPPAANTKDAAGTAGHDLVAAAKPAPVAAPPAPGAVGARIAAAAVASRTDDRRSALRPMPRVAAIQPRPPDHREQDWSERRPVNVHDVAQHTFIPRAMEPRPVMAARMPPPMPAGGSFLGMAHDMPAPPAPLPMPRPMSARGLIPYGGTD